MKNSWQKITFHPYPRVWNLEGTLNPSEESGKNIYIFCHVFHHFALWYHGCNILPFLWKLLSFQRNIEPYVSVNEWLHSDNTCAIAPEIADSKARIIDWQYCTRIKHSCTTSSIRQHMSLVWSHFNGSLVFRAWNVCITNRIQFFLI